MGRFSVELILSNNFDVRRAEEGLLDPKQIRQVTLQGLVDTGATRLVLPAKIAITLGLRERDPINVQYADGRRAKRKVVADVELAYGGRRGVFSAVVEPNRKDALIGAIVLEELDLVPDCVSQKLLPRDPKGVLAEIE